MYYVEAAMETRERKEMNRPGDGTEMATGTLNLQGINNNCALQIMAKMDMCRFT